MGRKNQKFSKKAKIHHNRDTMEYEYNDYQSWDGSSQASGEQDFLYVESIKSDYIPDNANKANPSVPGRAPRLADHLLNPEELARRNRRRARNREAANRQRDRRLAKVAKLEVEINHLKTDSSTLKNENDQLKAEIEKLKFQLQLQSNQTHQQQQQPVGGSLIPISQPGTVLMNPFECGQLTPTAFLVHTPVYKTATNLANSQHFQFPAGNKMQRLSSSSLEYLRVL